MYAGRVVNDGEKSGFLCLLVSNLHANISSKDARDWFYSDDAGHRHLDGGLPR